MKHCVNTILLNRHQQREEAEENRQNFIDDNFNKAVEQYLESEDVHGFENIPFSDETYLLQRKIDHAVSRRDLINPSPWVDFKMLDSFRLLVTEYQESVRKDMEPMIEKQLGETWDKRGQI